MSFPYEDYPKSGKPGQKITLNAPYSFNTPSSFSPFGAKVELFLRANKLQYDFSPALPFDKKKAPREKVPSIQYGNVIIPDSHFIIKFLENTYGDKLPIKPVSDKAQHGKALAAKSMVENYAVYSVLPYLAFTDKSLAEFGKNPALMIIPKLFRSTAIKRVLRPKSKKAAHVLGFRHSENDTIELLKEQALGLSELLGDKPYFGGDQLCPEDCSVWGVLSVILYQSVSKTVKEIYSKHQNLVQYQDRIEKIYFPDSNPSIVKTATEEFLLQKR